MDKNSSLYKTVLLAVVCAVAGLLLSAVNALTAPVIAQNAIKQVESTLNQFFPNGTFTDVTDDYVTDEYDLVDGVYEAEGEGYIFTLHNTGYDSGGFKIAIAFDNDGNIVGYAALEQSETAGKGSKAFEDDYISQVTSLTSTDSMPLLSGATITTKAVGEAVTQAEAIYNSIQGIAFDADAAADAAENAAPKSDASCEDNGDGTYACKVTGFAGELTATITVEDGAVVSVEDLEGDDYGDGVGDDWFDDASVFEGVTSADEVDAMSGGTVTSNAVKGMVQAALDAANGSSTSASESSDSDVCTDNGDGTYACKAAGFNGELTATITVEDGKVTAVEDLDGGDNGDGVGDDWFSDTSALEGVTSADEVDALSGATFTTNAVKEMIGAALEAAK